MFSFFENTAANDITLLILAFVVWAAVDYGIVKLIDRRKKEKSATASFTNRKPTIIY